MNQTVTFSQREFTSRWFSRDVLPLWERHLLQRAPLKSYLEIGVSEGQSLLWAFENLLAPDGHAIGVDNYTAKRQKNIPEMQANRERCLRNTAGARETGRLELIEWPSKNVLLSWCADKHDYFNASSHDEHQSFDLIYVDGSHWAWDALPDIVLSWELLTVGGVLIVDDVHRIVHRAKPLVRPAAEAFEHCYETRYSELYRSARQRAYVKME